MKLNNLKPAEGSVKTRKRIGRGPGSGLGGTSTRGTKGAKARSGYKKKVEAAFSWLRMSSCSTRIFIAMSAMSLNESWPESRLLRFSWPVNSSSRR